MNNVRPQLKLLTEEQIQQTHQYALRVLSETGVRVDSPSVIKILEKTGQVQVEDRRVRIFPELVEQAIQSAPSVIQVYDRHGNPAFRLGDDRLRFGVGVTSLYYQEPVNGNLELFTRQHMRTVTRLGSSLSNYDVVSTPGIVRDVPDELSDMYGNLEMFSNTTKPIVVLTSDESKFSPMMSMFEGLHGDISEKPFLLPYFNPVTPLVMNSGTLLKMEVAIERGLPFIFANFSMAGATTPFMPAGNLALLLAELLAGVTISQVMKPGTPISVGMYPGYFDMKALLHFYGPQSVLLNIASAEMLAHYKLPHCGTACAGMGWGMDLMALDAYWMNILSLILAGGGLAPFIGIGLAGKSISPCAVVYMNEVIDQALRFSNGFQLDDTQVALEEMTRVGPGGSFLSAPSTLKNYKTGYYSSPIHPRWDVEKWQAAGQPDAQEVLRKKTQAILQDLSAPDDYDVLIGKGEEYIKSLGY